jgi:hypothetical protein
MGADGGDHVRHPAGQPTPVVIPGATHEEAGQAQTRLDQTSVTTAPSLTTPPPSEVTVSEDNGEDTPEHRMSGTAGKDAVRVKTEGDAALRRSSRSTKCQTTRFDDFEVGEG